MDATTLSGILTDMWRMFAGQWLRAALLFALFSTGVVVGVFAYLNRYTRRSYFRLWTIAWIYYAIWLGVCIGMQESRQEPLLVMARRACIGISALCLAWGSFELTDRNRQRRELLYAIGLIVLWSYVAAYRIGEPLWITTPVMTLLGLASVYTGAVHFRFRARSRGAALLAWGFILWGLHLSLFAVQSLLPEWAALTGYFLSAVLALFIALGMIIFVLEEERNRHDVLLGEFRKGEATRRVLEQEVNVSEQKYRALFEAAGDAILLVDLETLDIVESNRKAGYYLGTNADEKTRPSFLTLCPSLPYRRGRVLDNKRMIEELVQPGAEFRVVRHNSAIVLCEGSASLIQYNQRPAVQLTLREVTERKRLEQQLRQQEKLSALGQLIAGVAHELNNPLAVIMGYAQLLAKQSAGDTKTHGELQKILHESERAAKIVRNLLTFARPREPRMSAVDVNRLLKTISETHEAELESSAVDFRLKLDPKVPRTMADPHQIEQVVTNLLSNAIQALADHNGRRQIELATVLLHGNVIRLTIADTGPGIPAEIIHKIFDPFFTTKPPGKGTGLGLSICHAIVEEHRGRLHVESELGRGAQFHVELPVVTPAGDVTPEAELAAVTPPTPDAARYRILIVDDEPGIVEVLQAILEGRGYTVDTARNGQAAVERLRAHNYDLLFSDLAMPGMDGEALYRHVRETHPSLAPRIIFITGDTVSRSARNFLEGTGNRWFGKPFSVAEIEATVANFLTAPPVGD